MPPSETRQTPRTRRARCRHRGDTDHRDCTALAVRLDPPRGDTTLQLPNDSASHPSLDRTSSPSLFAQQDRQPERPFQKSETLPHNRAAHRIPPDTGCLDQRSPARISALPPHAASKAPRRHLPASPNRPKTAPLDSLERAHSPAAPPSGTICEPPAWFADSPASLWP